MRLGACSTRYFSPSSGYSCKTLSKLPLLLVGRALVLDTGDCGALGLGSFAGTGLSVARSGLQMWNDLACSGDEAAHRRTSCRVTGNIFEEPLEVMCRNWP